VSGSSFPKEDARAHIEQLADDHDITIVEIRRQWTGEADTKDRCIYIADPTSPVRYMIALHEIGHIVDKAARILDDQGNGPACEGAAWGWAYDNALPALLKYLTPTHWRRIGTAWVTGLGKRARAASPYG